MKLGSLPNKQMSTSGSLVLFSGWLRRRGIAEIDRDRDKLFRLKEYEKLLTHYFS